MMRLEQQISRRGWLVGALGVVCMWGIAACGGSDAKSDGGSNHQDSAQDTPEEDAGDDEKDATASEVDAGHATQDAGHTDASASDAAADGGDAGAAAPTCAEYCTKIQANCSGANAQYPSAAVCMAVCGSFPKSADMTGNTLGCRFYHAGNAAADAVMHCNHAGITGGDKDPTDTTGGPCGEGCAAFCNEALVACAAVWTSKEACMAECKMFPASTNSFSTADTAGNTFNCRAYHLSAASTTPMPHCMHISKVSSTCK